MSSTLALSAPLPPKNVSRKGLHLSSGESGPPSYSDILTLHPPRGPILQPCPPPTSPGQAGRREPGNKLFSHPLLARETHQPPSPNTPQLTGAPASARQALMAPALPIVPSLLAPVIPAPPPPPLLSLPLYLWPQLAGTPDFCCPPPHPVFFFFLREGSQCSQGDLQVTILLPQPPMLGF